MDPSERSSSNGGFRAERLFESRELLITITALLPPITSGDQSCYLSPSVYLSLSLGEKSRTPKHRAGQPRVTAPACELKRRRDLKPGLDWFFRPRESPPLSLSLENTRTRCRARDPRCAPSLVRGGIPSPPSPPRSSPSLCLPCSRTSGARPSSHFRSLPRPAYLFPPLSSFLFLPRFDQFAVLVLLAFQRWSVPLPTTACPSRARYAMFRLPNTDPSRTNDLPVLSLSLLQRCTRSTSSLSSSYLALRRSLSKEPRALEVCAPFAKDFPDFPHPFHPHLLPRPDQPFLSEIFRRPRACTSLHLTPRSSSSEQVRRPIPGTCSTLPLVLFFPGPRGTKNGKSLYHTRDHTSGHHLEERGVLLPVAVGFNDEIGKGIFIGRSYKHSHFHGRR